MSDSPRGSAFNPMHRIVGAVILVALAVVFIPMFLRPAPHGQKASPASPALVSPTPPAASPDSYSPSVPPMVPAPPAGAASNPVTPPPAAPAAAQATPKAAATTSAVASAKTPSSPVAGPRRAREASQAPVERHHRTAAKEAGWFVQVGSFHRGSSAQRLASRLRHEGFAARVTSDLHRRQYRVRLGPYVSKTFATREQRGLGHAWAGSTWVLHAPG